MYTCNWASKIDHQCYYGIYQRGIMTSREDMPIQVTDNAPLTLIHQLTAFLFTQLPCQLLQIQLHKIILNNYSIT